MPGAAGKEKVLVSVVIPTYNRPQLLKRAITSALQQSFQELEIVVVCDGPDPSTAAAVASFQDARIRLIELQVRVGGAEARNVGARASSGRWVALLDDDDEWLSEKLAQQLLLAARQEEDNYVVASRYLFARPGKPSQIWPGHVPRTGEPVSEFLFSSCGGFQTSVYLVPRSLLLRIPFTPGLKKHQDWDWLLRLATDPLFRLLWCEEPLSIYWAPVKTGSSVSSILDWHFSASWARANLSRMTRRAYAMFMVRICLRAAVEAKASRRELLALLRDLFRSGQPDLRLAGEAGLACLLTPAARQALSEWTAPLRSRRTPKLPR